MQHTRRSLPSLLASSDKVVGQDWTHEQRGLLRLIAGLLPKSITFPPLLEQQYRDARARTSWRRDIVGYAVFLFLMSSLYVVTTCYLHGQAEAASAANSGGLITSNASAISTFSDAPSAAQYYKLVLHPKYRLSAAAAAVNSSEAACTAAAREPTLQQLLHHEAAVIAANLASRSSSRGSVWGILSVLIWPQQLAVLYLWRVWVQSDLALLVKMMTGAGALALALLNPGYYCTHKLRTPLVAVYLTAPLVLLPLQLLAADTNCAPGDCAAAAAAAAAAQGYQVLLSYAPLVVLVSSVLHPLPFCWQATVNLVSWASLAAASLVLRLKYAPPAAAAAAYGTSTTATAAAAAGALGPTADVSARENVVMLLFELLFGSLDGLLLSVLLPVLLGAWHSRKARKGFLSSGYSGSISSTAVLEQAQDNSTVAVQQAEELVDVVQTCAGEPAPLRSTDEMVSCVSSVASNTSLLKKAATNAAAANVAAAAAAAAATKSATPSDSALAAAAGQFCIVRGISIPSAATVAAAAANSNPNSSGSPSSCASSTLDQPKTPIMMLESRGGSSCSGKSVRLALPILAEPSIAAATTGFTGSRSGASSSASSGSGVHDGEGGTAAMVYQQQQGSGPPGAGGRVQHAVGTRTPERPSALYSSPLETVVVSFKLASRAAPGAAAAAMPGAGAAVSRSRSPSPPALATTAAMQASTGLLSSASATGAVAAPAGHGGASNQLKAEIEAAVRHVVAQSEYHVLCTSVSTFPGCVHLVVNLQLCRASDVAAQLAAAAAGGSAVWIDAPVTASSSSNNSLADVDWGRAIDWGQVVRQLQQYKFVADRGVAHLVAVASVPDRAGLGPSARTELHLQYMLVQDGAGRDQWYWQAAPIPPLTRAITAPSPAAAATVSNAPVNLPIIGSRDSPLQAAGSRSSRVGSEGAAAPPTPLLLTSADSAAGPASPQPAAAAAATNDDDDDDTALMRFNRRESLALQMPSAAGPSVSFNSAASADMVPAQMTAAVTTRDGSADAIMHRESATAIMFAESAPPAVVLQPGLQLDSWEGGSGRSSLDSVTSTATSSSMTPARGLSPDWRQLPQRQNSLRSSTQSLLRSSTQSFGSILPHHAHIPMSDHMVLPNANNTPTSGAAAAMRLAAAVHGHAQGISMSGLTLPTDLGWLEMLPGPNLKIPDNLAASLTAAAAGLRIVITGSTRSAAAAGMDLGSYEPGSPASSSTSSSSSLSFGTRSAALKPLVDVIFWPNGTSSSSNGGRAWPAGGTIAVQQLLPPGSQGSWLTHTYGPVLAINILVTPANPAAGTPATRSSTMTECLLLQLPLLLVPSVMCQGLQWLGTKMTREARSYEVAFHQHMLPLVRDIGSLLLGPQSDRFLSLTAPVAAAVAAGMAASSSNPHRELLLQQHQAVYGWLAANVLGFLRSQGAVECGSALRQMISPHMPAAATTGTPATAADIRDGETSAAPTEVAAMPQIDQVAAEVAIAAVALDIPAALPPIAVAAAVDAPAVASPAVSGITPAEYTQMVEYTCETKPMQEPVKEPIVEAISATPKSDHFSVAEALKAAAAATEDAQAARTTVAETSAALAAALESLARLSASAAAAEQQARRAESAAALAARRAAAAEVHTQRQHALYLIRGGNVESGVLGQSVWGLLGAANRLRNGGATEVLSNPPVLPEHVSQRDVLLGFSDERLEVQYRRLKALQIRCVDQVALAVQVLKEATIVWKIARALHAVSDTRLSLILLCKYEAVTLLPYLVALLCPDFWVQHRNFTIMLSQVACALTVGMITATEIYRHEWAQLLHVGNATVVSNLTAPGFKTVTSGALPGSQDLILISRPGMLIAWFYLVVPLLQQLCVPDQLVSCVAQAIQSYLAYRFIFKGEMGLGWLLGWLGLGSLVSLGVAYVADSFTRRQAVAAARRSLTQTGNN